MCFACTCRKDISMLTILSFALHAALMVSSPDFGDKAMIPKKFTCQGASISPALHFGELPSQTKSLAIIMHDPDAPRQGGFTHWVVFNIDPARDIPQNFKGGMQGLNGSGKAGYTGPCPPSGVHHYHFMVYALDTRLQLSENTGKAELEKAMKGHIRAQGELVGLCSK